MEMTSQLQEVTQVRRDHYPYSGARTRAHITARMLLENVLAATSTLQEKGITFVKLMIKLTDSKC